MNLSANKLFTAAVFTILVFFITEPIKRAYARKLDEHDKAERNQL